MDTDRPAEGDDDTTTDPEWAALVGVLRRTYLQDPAPEVAARHLAAMAEATRPRRRRRRLVVAAAAAGAVSLAGGATLAAAGELPAPLQTQVAGLAGRVHISLPSPPVNDPPEPEPAPGPSPGKGGAPTTPARPPSTGASTGGGRPAPPDARSPAPPDRGAPGPKSPNPGDDHRRPDPPGRADRDAELGEKEHPPHPGTAPPRPEPPHGGN
jgi:hypothetical protein